MIYRLMKAVIVADDAGKKIDEWMDKDQTIKTDNDTGNYELTTTHLIEARAYGC